MGPAPLWNFWRHLLLLPWNLLLCSGPGLPLNHTSVHSLGEANHKRSPFDYVALRWIYPFYWPVCLFVSIRFITVGHVRTVCIRVPERSVFSSQMRKRFTSLGIRSIKEDAGVEAELNWWILMSVTSSPSLWLCLFPWNIRLSLPQTVGGVFIERLADYLLVKSVFGFSLAWDGSSGVYLKMSEEHQGAPCGLCGNFNHIPGDDLTTARGMAGPCSSCPFTYSPQSLLLYGQCWLFPVFDPAETKVEEVKYRFLPG